MKKICFIASNRVHLARQQLLLKELEKHFKITIFQPQERKDGMASSSILYSVEFNNFLINNEFDYILARGDRYEVLPMVMVASYKGIPVIHIEGGDLSGMIDNKVRYAITHLSDYHFVTNKESHTRLVNVGVPLDRIWNFGSLDVEFASKVEPKKLRNKNYILVAYHPTYNEDENELDKALQSFKKYDIIRIGSNRDAGREYGEDTFSPEDYINLMRGAKVLVGNSSSLLKEASILGVGVVLVGDRQNKRLMPKNIVQVPCEADKIKLAIKYQLGNKYDPDTIYFNEDTSIEIAQKLMEIL